MAHDRCAGAPFKGAPEISAPCFPGRAEGNCPAGFDRPRGMTSATPEPSLGTPPPWPHCGHGATAEDPVGCRGIHVPGHTACLAHLAGADRDAYFAGLTPGADIDHRGTPFTEPLLHTLLHALRNPFSGAPHLGTARFDEARFSGDAGFGRAWFAGDAGFDGARFSGDAGFGHARFSGDARFHGVEFSGTAEFGWAQFSGDAEFGGAKFSGEARFEWAQFAGDAGFLQVRFTGDAWFLEARFSGTAQFRWAQFAGDVRFYEARFSSTARFGWAQFSGDAEFGHARFSDDAEFHKARFSGTAEFGPVVCAKEVDLSGAVFEVPVTLEIAAHRVRCDRTRWESTATVRLRYATVDLSHAVLSFPVAVTTHPAPFTYYGTGVDESLMAGARSGVRVVSARGVDAMHLVLTDIDLTDCLFSGAFHLDQLRLEGRCTFAATPTGLHVRRSVWPYRWTRRRTLAEEHHWRARTAGRPAPAPGRTPSPRHWRTGPHHPDPDLTPGPQDVATLYRHLRKAFEDGKNEPGAADFYYGEMEMRRHDRTGTPPGERFLLWGYWLLSGYGLRATRALAWLLGAMCATLLTLMLWGLPADAPKPTTTGRQVEAGERITLTTDTPDPRNPTGPYHERLSAERFEKALRVVINSVVFRSSGQDLTTSGTYTEMASRLVEPVLLGLAVLAVRSRVKR